MKNTFLSVFILIFGSVILGGCIKNQQQTGSGTEVGSNQTTLSGDSTDVSEQDITQSSDGSQVLGHNYVTYSPEVVTQAATTGRAVLFFHASWCPTCRVANQDFIENGQNIPDEITVIRTDYDTNDQLKKKYGVTYQHTFVQVDTDGNLITKWNGGSIDEVIGRVL